MFSMRMENLGTTLCFGRDRWIIFFCLERQQREFGAVCVEIKWNQVQGSIYLGS